MTKKTVTLPRGIRLHKSGYIVDCTINGKRLTKTAKTLQEALEIQASLKAGKSLESVQKKAVWTLEQAFEKTCKIRNWQGKAIKDANSRIKAIYKIIRKDILIDEISLEMIDRFIEYQKSKNLKNGTINQKLLTLSSVLTTAFEREVIHKKIKIKLLKEDSNRIRFLSPQEEKEMGDAIYKINPIAYDIFQILLYTGFRLSELWNLKVNDIDFEHNILSLWKTKTNKPRSVPIVPKIRPLFEKYVSIAKKNKQETLFKKWYNRKFDGIWIKAKKEIGLEKDNQFVPHVLRHTCATRLVQRGIPLNIVKEWLGHSNINMTMRYAHFSPDNLQNAARILGEDKDS